MEWNQSKFQTDLNAALKRFGRGEVDALCDSLVAHINNSAGVADESFAKTVLGVLQRKRRFGQLRRVADAFIQNGLTAPRIRRQYAQSLLDQGELSAAIPFLNTLVADMEQIVGQEFEMAEARGLLGRAYKQIYVHTGRGAPERAAVILNAALQSYQTVYDSDPKEYLWHGINSAALLIRAQTDQITIDGIDDPGRRSREIAANVLARISELWENRQANMWNSGTAMEACLALDRHDEARQWLQRYVREPQADAFELGSTLRQMEEIWRLNVDTEPGASILPILRSELLQKEGGAFTVEAQHFRPGVLATKSTDYLEKIFGSVRYHSYQFMLLSIDRARAVARIEHAPGQGYGTGFLLPAAELNEKLGDGYVLVTNAHVVSDHPDVKQALNPDDAIVTFELLKEEGIADKEYTVTELIWTSPPWKLDTSVLRLNGVPEGIKSIPVHRRLPLPDGEQRVYVIGHPKGGSLSFSIQDNVLLDHDAPYLHYRAPTEGGSSGSPVFNVQWKLIGLHHAGSRQMPKLHDQKGTYEANEGIWIEAVKNMLAKDLFTAPQ